MMMIWSQPAASASSTPYWMIGLSTSGSISLGCAFVAGRKRVPSPAAGNTPLRTFIGTLYICGRSVPRADAADPLEDGDDRQHARRLDEHERDLVRSRVLHEDGREAERRRDEEDQQHALGLREAEGLEPVADVVLAGVGVPLGHGGH